MFRKPAVEYIEHSGKVIAGNGNQVQVRIVQTSACSACHAKTMCTAADSREKVIDALDVEKNLQVGEDVVVLVQEKLGWKAVFIAYLVPFVVLITSLVVAGHYIDNEIATGCIGLTAVALYYLGLYGFRGKLKKEFEFMALRPVDIQ